MHRILGNAPYFGYVRGILEFHKSLKWNDLCKSRSPIDLTHHNIQRTNDGRNVRDQATPAEIGGDR
jgi:hypothetical protein